MARTAPKTGMALLWHIAGLARTHPGTPRLPAAVRSGRGCRGVRGTPRNPARARVPMAPPRPGPRPTAAVLSAAMGPSAMGYAIGLRPAELGGFGDWLALALTPKPKAAVKPER